MLFQSALSAGFTSQEISALTGARAAGWATENGIPADNELGLTSGVHHGGGSLHNESHGTKRLDDRSDWNGSTNGDAMGNPNRIQAAAVAALAAGLASKQQEDAGDSHNGQANAPGLTMGIGLGLAGGVAATINAALFQNYTSGRGDRNLAPSPTITAAAAAAISPPLKDLGIHQVEGSDGPQGWLKFKFIL